MLACDGRAGRVFCLLSWFRLELGTVCFCYATPSALVNSQLWNPALCPMFDLHFKCRASRAGCLNHLSAQGKEVTQWEEKSETRLWPCINVQAAGQSFDWESPQQATNAHLAQRLGSNPGTTQGPACLLWFMLHSSSSTALHPVFLLLCSCTWRWGLKKTQREEFLLKPKIACHDFTVLFWYFFLGQHVTILNLSLNWHTGSLSNHQVEGTGQTEFTGHSQKPSGWKYHFQLLFDEVTSRSRATAHTTQATAKWFAGPVNAALRKRETFAKSVRNELDVF